MRNDKNDYGSVDLAKEQALPAQSNAGEGATASRVSGTISRLLMSRGFLDREQLLVALGIEEPDAAGDRDERLQRVASKLGYAAQSLGLHGKSAYISAS